MIPRPYLILFTLWLLLFSMFSQVMIVSPILLQIGEELDVPVARLGLLITAYALSMGVCALATGPVSDRVGRRRVLLVGSLIMTVALLLHGLAWSFASLLALRALAGLAAGMVSASAVAFVGDYYPPHRRGWANGWTLSGIAVGQIAGVPAGTLLADHFGFRAPFVGCAALMLAVSLMIWRVIPHLDTGSGSERLTIAGAARGYAELLRSKTTAAAAMVFFPMFGGITLFLSYYPTWLRSEHGFSGGDIAVMYLLGGVGNILFGPRAGRLSDRVGRKPVILFACIGLAVLKLLAPLAVDHWTANALFFVVLGCFACRGGPMRSLITELVPSHQRGSLVSLTVAFGQTGLALGGALAGPIYIRFGFAACAMSAAATALVAAAAIWRLVPESLPPDKRTGAKAEPPPAAPGVGSGAGAIVVEVCKAEPASTRVG